MSRVYGAEATELELREDRLARARQAVVDATAALAAASYKEIDRASDVLDAARLERRVAYGAWHNELGRLKRLSVEETRL